MRRVLRINNFKNYLFLFFVIQIHFIIKGSNAGNTQQAQQGNQPGNQQQQQQQQAQQIDEDHDLVQIESFEHEESKVVEHVDVRSVELVIPKAARVYLSNEKPFEQSPESETYAQLRSSFPPRPKSHSRQSSHGFSSGEHTPSHEYDWIDSNSETSTSSGLAHKLLIPDDKKYDPITFEEICFYLESTASVLMSEEELLTTCRRILTNDYLVKALNLQIYVKNFEHNTNAIKIHDILFSYLGYSGDLMSRCSSSNSHSTLETPPNSPIQRFESPEQPQKSSGSFDATVPDIEIVDGIAKEHLISHHHHHHSHHTHFEANNFMLRTRMGMVPNPSFTRINYRNFQSMFSAVTIFPLDPVREERSMSEVTEITNRADSTEEDNDGPIIEEID